jgi:hypothetical protein
MRGRQFRTTVDHFQRTKLYLQKLLQIDDSGDRPPLSHRSPHSGATTASGSLALGHI